jgi:N-glycosylase/DNA lyase
MACLRSVTARSPAPSLAAVRQRFSVHDYDLAATLNSGQTFRWNSVAGGWEGVVGNRWVRLQQARSAVDAETALPCADWRWLGDYLQVRLELAPVLATFPPDETLAAAVRACRGLRLLRQDPWECLASFILSSTKQITQIRQVITCLCSRLGEPIRVPLRHAPAFAFPGPGRIVDTAEAELRSCGMGFRAPYLHRAARQVAEGRWDLHAPGTLPLPEARAALMQLPGVGPKIADCVLLFAYGRREAFPIDVWMARVIQHSYLSGRRLPLRRLREFAASRFGPWAGYAQQYLFHYARLHARFPN